jgi:PKD repeat protein
MEVEPRITLLNPTLMHMLTRSLALALATAAGLAASAQNTIFVHGHAAPCNSAMNGSTVIIVVNGTSGNSITATTTMNPNCYYSMELSVPDTAGHVFVSGSCGNGTMATDSTFYSTTSGSNTNVIVDLNCGWTPPPCEACFTVQQTAPFTGTFVSCSTGGVGTTGLLWDFSDGGSVTGNNIVHEFPGPGAYTVCLNINYSSPACQDQVCHHVYVDADGNFSDTPPTDCHACMEITQAEDNGTPLPWFLQLTSCATGSGNVLVEWQLPNGSWASGNDLVINLTQGAGAYLFCQYITTSNGCTSTICDTVFVDANGFIGNSNVEPCEAGFWVLQAYQNGDTLGGEPIPNTLWVWNLSNGGTGLFQFMWDFGDGTTSTEPFPTHVYAGTGPYELCLTIWDSEGCTDTYCETISVDENGLYNGMIVGGGNMKSVLTIHVIEELGTAMAEVNALEALELWPNPTTNELNIALGSSMHGNVPVMVIDATGRTVLQDRRSIANGTNRFTINTAHLEAGPYLLRIGDAHPIVRRFVKAQ